MSAKKQREKGQEKRGKVVPSERLLEAIRKTAKERGVPGIVSGTLPVFLREAGIADMRELKETCQNGGLPRLPGFSESTRTFGYTVAGVDELSQ